MVQVPAVGTVSYSGIESTIMLESLGVIPVYRTCITHLYSRTVVQGLYGNRRYRNEGFNTHLLEPKQRLLVYIQEEVRYLHQAIGRSLDQKLWSRKGHP